MVSKERGEEIGGDGGQTGCVSVERRVTPKSSLLKGPCGGRREQQDGGGIACGTHHFYRGHYWYTLPQKYRHTHTHTSFT